MTIHAIPPPNFPRSCTDWSHAQSVPSLKPSSGSLIETFFVYFSFFMFLCNKSGLVHQDHDRRWQKPEFPSRIITPSGILYVVTQPCRTPVMLLKGGAEKLFRWRFWIHTQAKTGSGRSRNTMSHQQTSQESVSSFSITPFLGVKYTTSTQHSGDLTIAFTVS